MKKTLFIFSIVATTACGVEGYDMCGVPVNCSDEQMPPDALGQAIGATQYALGVDMCQDWLDGMGPNSIECADYAQPCSASAAVIPELVSWYENTYAPLDDETRDSVIEWSTHHSQRALGCGEPLNEYDQLSDAATLYDE